MKKKERETLSQQGDGRPRGAAEAAAEASWKLRLQKSTGQLENPSRLRVIRRDIARSRRTGARWR